MWAPPLPHTHRRSPGGGLRGNLPLTVLVCSWEGLLPCPPAPQLGASASPLPPWGPLPLSLSKVCSGWE